MLIARHKSAIFTILVVIGTAFLWIREKIVISLASNAKASVTERVDIKVQVSTRSQSTAIGVLKSPHRQEVSMQDEGARHQSSSNSKAFCRILRANSGLPLAGPLKMYAFEYEQHGEEGPGMIAFVQSRECPDELFSMVRIDGNDRVKELIDCRFAQKEEILMKSGIQGEILDYPVSPERMLLAISGPGYFITDCPNGLFMQRSGDFQRRGREIWQGACRVLNGEGEPFVWDGHPLDEHGCSKEGQCPAIVEADPKFTTFIDRTTFEIADRSMARLLPEPRVFSNSLETLDSADTGPTGPHLTNRIQFTPPADCSTVQ